MKKWLHRCVLLKTYLHRGGIKGVEDVSRKKRCVSFLVIIMIFVIWTSASVSFGAKEKKKYLTWQDVAADMALVFDEALDDVEADAYKDAYTHINSAYFGYYEVQGFEKNVMVYISADRVNHIEAQFADIKHTLLGNQEGHKVDILKSIEGLKVKVYKDAMVLDGVALKSDPDSVGNAVFGDGESRYLETALGKSTEEEPKVKGETSKPVVKEVDPDKRNWATFLTAFGLLLREGIEAILVVVAIISYLIKTGNKHLCKNVYIGVLVAVVSSVVLAGAIEVILGGSGVARELIEGWTMFLAVIVLFYVSNWMISKADTIAWERYINEKVQQSVDRRSQNTLIFAAFLAVFREGAELILFYKASFSAGMNSPKFIALGIAVGIVVLAIIYVAYRYLSLKIPLKPFFIFTSVLLFLMCISFMGKGVIELTEANVISGRTIIPAMNGFHIDVLNIYDRAETLVPQIMLVIASLWMIIKGLSKKKKGHE